MFAWGTMANPKLTKRDARLIRPAERSEALHLAGVDITPLVSADQSADYEVAVISGNEGHGPPPHSHPWDETYFVLRGEVVFGVGQDEQVFTAGALVHYLLENAIGFALTSLAKQSLSQAGIALLPCSKALLMFPMVPLLRTTWQ